MALPETGQVRYAVQTHVGKVRAANEDSVLALPDQKLWAVSDGMGGHKNGAFASQTVTEALAALQPGLEGGQLMQAAREALLAAHRTILDESARHGGATIGATAVVLLLSNAHFACLWAGDSRLYLLSQGALTRVSRDHSLVADLVDAGKLTDEEAEAHPQANVITRAVGVGESLEIDKRSGTVLPGDRFLLCSDGLTRYADDAHLEFVLSTEPIETVASKLLDIALEGGGADNISVIVVDIPPAAQGGGEDTESTLLPRSGGGE